MLQKGNIVIPMDNLTTQSVYMLLQSVLWFQEYANAIMAPTQHSLGGKTDLQAYGALVSHLSNEYSYGDAYWVCYRLGRIFKSDR